MDEKIVWKKEYEVGVSEIDMEHKIFVKTIQKIDTAFENNLKKEFIESLLVELYKYVDFHFKSEENIMLRYDYPFYEDHKHKHEDLLHKLSELMNTFDIEYINKVELIDFLLDWFKEHTAKVDIKIGDYLRSINVI